MKKFLIYIVCMGFIPVLGCIEADPNDSKKPGKESAYMNKNIYPVIFSDSRRSSYINKVSSAEGVIAWKSYFNADHEIRFNPRALLVSNNRIFAYSGELIVAVDSEGKHLWKKNIRSESPVSLSGDNIYFRKIEAEDELAAVTFDGREIERTMWLLESDDACSPLYIEPLETGFLAMSQCISPPGTGSKAIVFYKKQYETEDFIWVDHITGRPSAPPLHIIENENFIVFSEKEVAIYDAGADKNGNIKTRFEIRLEKLMAASADSTGTLYLLGTHENQLVLIAIDETGGEKWRWNGGPVTDDFTVKQPPVVGSDGTISVPLGRTLKSIKDGQLIREFTIEERLIDYCTTLADGSVLITAENSLYHVDAEGQKIYGLLFDNDIVTPPVVDGQGHVYFATAYEIIRLD